MAEQLSFHHHLNTSYVNVNQIVLHQDHLKHLHLNTSYVNVNRSTPALSYFLQ